MHAIRTVVEPLVQEVSSLRAEIADLRETLEDKVPDPERFWSYRDVAKKCGVSRSTVTTWVNRGQVKKVEVDGLPCIPDEELRRLLKNACRPSYKQVAR